MRRDQHTYRYTPWRHGSIISMLQELMAALINHPLGECLLRLIGLLAESH